MVLQIIISESCWNNRKLVSLSFIFGVKNTTSWQWSSPLVWSWRRRHSWNVGWAAASGATEQGERESVEGKDEEARQRQKSRISEEQRRNGTAVAGGGENEEERERGGEPGSGGFFYTLGLGLFLFFFFFEFVTFIFF